MTKEEYAKVCWLRRYQELLRLERELALEVERLQAAATHVTPLLSAMPGGGAGADKIPRQVEELLEAKASLCTQMDASAARRAEVLAAIAALPDPRMVDLMRRRYILGQRWERIAVDCYTDLRWIHRLHHAALRHLTIESH